MNMQQIPELLRGAVGLHQRGQLAEAEKLYAKVLAIDAKQFDALHLLGLLKHQRGDSGQAIRLMAAALDINPTSSPALLNYGGVLYLLNRHEEALACYDRVLAADPKQPEAHYNRGNALMGLGRTDEALQAYDRAVALKPDHAFAHYNRGNALVALGRLDDGLAAFDRSLELQPEFVEALLNRGKILNTLRRNAEALVCFEKALALSAKGTQSLNNRAAALLHLERYEEALECCEKQLAADPNDTEALENCGTAHRALQQNKRALACFERMLELRPTDAKAGNNRAVTLIALSRYDEALAWFDRVLEADPANLDALINRGLALVGRNRLEEALVCFDSILARAPEHADALNHRGKVLRNLNRYEEAVACLESVADIQPDHAESRWNAGASRLVRGDLQQGWNGYEWRWKTADFPTEAPKLKQPRWAGERVHGPILVWGEQGLGDEIIYSSMVPDLSKYSDSVILAVGRRLGPLFARSFPDVRVIKRSEADVQEFAVHSPLGSLGLYLRPTFESFPKRPQGYLVADRERAASLRRRLSPGGEPLVGLSWVSTSRKDSTISQIKSAQLRDFNPVLKHLGCRFIDLQYGDTLAERLAYQDETGIVVRRLEEIDNTNDIDALAALVTACDLVVTVSNTTAHLAGALGRPTIVLVPFGRARFWYWFKEGIKCPWYPNVRVLYQNKDEPWSALVARAAPEAAALMSIGKDLARAGS